MVLIAVGIVIVTSCVVLTPATVETRKEMLTKIPVGLPQEQMHPATLLVFAPETSSAMTAFKSA